MMYCHIHNIMNIQEKYIVHFIHSKILRKNKLNMAKRGQAQNLHVIMLFF